MYWTCLNLTCPVKHGMIKCGTSSNFLNSYKQSDFCANTSWKFYQHGYPGFYFHQQPDIIWNSQPHKMPEYNGDNLEFEAPKPILDQRGIQCKIESKG